ncbi:hypothetical protein PPTG_22878 [Phytophthora nicotianae INRA-310]|uniref:Uncharacterized protein n=1 Tax=Phytophthora nicotianae (strain INRA-310) TaxID=761204 RepID=W2Q8C3_PHYN3|nr:hypothetical protein PPTG_22878 [Phytophthora nicotianae INRA-310]ETN09423.1 hypothetical protein PPTG_22878 [Phytophthora nicotianae INRA-310]
MDSFTGGSAGGSICSVSSITGGGGHSRSALRRGDATTCSSRSRQRRNGAVATPPARDMAKTI